MSTTEKEPEHGHKRFEVMASHIGQCRPLLDTVEGLI
jgi:hypothetical protein